MADEWHVNWLKEGVENWNARRKKVKFKPDLSGVNFANLIPDEELKEGSQSNFFNRINLISADLEGANLSGLSFKRARFTYAKLVSANLDKSDFRDALFSRADLRNVSARNCLFQGAKFKSSKIENADFTGSDFSYAILTGSDISEQQLESFSHRIGLILREKVKDIGSSHFTFDYQEVITQALTHHKASSLPEVKDKNVYDVFYGTNRKPILSNGSVIDYGSKRNAKIDYGVCEVIVPETHKVGSIGSPLWKRLLKGDDRLKIKQIIQINHDIFWVHVKKQLRKSGNADNPTLFIHGYNNTFKEAVIRAAQIGRDLGIGSGIGLFSWPSKGGLLKYIADENAVEASKYYLADFIEQYAKISGDCGLNIIAHSMGCRCLLLAMEVLSGRSSPALKKIGQIILAAADVDQGLMKKLGPFSVNNVKRTTSYVATKDRAVQISEWLHDFPRVGVLPPVFVMNGMDTVIVNNSDLIGLGHGYVSDSRSVLSDMFQVLKSNLTPDKRTFVTQLGSGNQIHWKIKE